MCGGGPAGHVVAESQHFAFLQQLTHDEFGTYAKPGSYDLDRPEGWLSATCGDSRTVYARDAYVEVFERDLKGRHSCWSLDDSGALRLLSLQ